MPLRPWLSVLPASLVHSRVSFISFMSAIAPRVSYISLRLYWVLRLLLTLASLIVFNYKCRVFQNFTLKWGINKITELSCSVGYRLRNAKHRGVRCGLVELAREGGRVGVLLTGEGSGGAGLPISYLDSLCSRTKPMGKSQKGRCMRRRHNPIRVPDSHLPKGLTAASSNNNNNTQAVLPIIKRVPCIDIRFFVADLESFKDGKR